MIYVNSIAWEPIETIPDDRKDGRQILLWSDGKALLCRYIVGAPADLLLPWIIETGEFRGTDILAPPGVRFWADINPPE